MSSVPPSSFAHPGPPQLPELPDGVVPTPAPKPERRGLAAVPAWVPFAAMLATFVTASVASVLIVGGASAAGADIKTGDLPPGILISGTLVQDVALIVFSFVFAKVWAGEVRPSTFGFRRTRLGPALAWSAAVYAAFWIAIVIYGAIVGVGPEQDLVDDLRDEDSLLVLGGFAVMVGLAAPIAEEVFFRGFLFGVLRERIGLVAGMLISGAVFGLIHAAGTPFRTLGVLVILGIGLCFLYYKTNSLLPCIGLHALHNSISFSATKGLVWWGFLLLVSASVVLTVVAASAIVAREERAA